MEREVGGGIGMGNTCKSMADSFQCMTKPTTIKKKKRDVKDKAFKQLKGCDTLNRRIRFLFSHLWGQDLDCCMSGRGIHIYLI